MKKTILAVSAGTILSLLLVMGCQSAAEQNESAQKKVEAAKTDLKNAQEDAYKASVKAATAEQWKEFKTLTEAQIKENDATIANLRVKIKSANATMQVDYNNRIDILAEKNTQLKKRMDEYSGNQTDWETFKSEFSHDMTELGKALKGFAFSSDKK